jgi:hypothetical protein
MLIFLLILIQIMGHLGLYAAGLKQRPAFGSERTIFLYHLFSWILCVTIFSGWALITGGLQLAAMTGALAGSVHGIYSLSFLELWSLTQGSYSLSILADISRDPSLSQVLPSPNDLAEIGRQKREARQLVLRNFGLLNERGEITRAGRGAAFALSVLISLCNGRSLNHK